jgi:hypothetical protein
MIRDFMIFFMFSLLHRTRILTILTASLFGGGKRRKNLRKTHKNAGHTRHETQNF